MRAIAFTLTVYGLSLSAACLLELALADIPLWLLRMEVIGNSVLWAAMLGVLLISPRPQTAGGGWGSLDRTGSWPLLVITLREGRSGWRAGQGRRDRTSVAS